MERDASRTGALPLGILNQCEEKTKAGPGSTVKEEFETSRDDVCMVQTESS